MIMPARLRKLALTVHVASSVGWLGAVAAFLVLAIVGLLGQDAQTVRAAYLVMDLLGRTVLAPLSLASLLSGLLQALGTEWGLIRHYWVLFKALITVFATGVLLMYMPALDHLSGLARAAPSDGGLGELRTATPVVHAGAGLLVLLVATTLSVYKPKGVTRYGLLAKKGRGQGTTPGAGP